MDNDDALMARTARGDRCAFEAIVRAHQPCLLRLAYGMLGNRETAQDVVQEVFIRLWRTRHRYQEQGLLLAYLIRIARNVCLDRIREARHSIEPMTGIAVERAVSEHPGQTAAIADALRMALGKLSAEQRAVFLLSEREGLSYKQIASALGCPLGTVASRKSAAVETLRSILGPWLRGEEE